MHTRSCSRRWVGGLVVLGVAFLASGASGQKSGEFDANEELAGFETIRDWDQAWMLQKFSRQHRKTLTADERAALLKEWDEARPKIEARHARAEKDGYYAVVDRTRKEVLKRPFFEHVPYEVIEDYKPYALFVELPGLSALDDAVRAPRIAKEYAPFLAAFRDKLDREIAPLVGGPPDASAYVVWVLKDVTSYERFFREYGGDPKPLSVRAHYSSTEQWSFTWSPSSTSGPEFIEGVQTLLHELTHAYLDRLVPGERRAPNEPRPSSALALIRSHWVNEGLPEYLKRWKRHDKDIDFEPDGSSPPQASDDETTDLHLAFRDWIALEDGSSLDRAALEFCRKRNVDPRLAELVTCRFYIDAYHFVAWLETYENGKYREAFHRYLAAEMSGHGGLEAFKKHLGDVVELPIDQLVIQPVGNANVAKAKERAGPPAVPAGPRFAAITSVESLFAESTPSDASARCALAWRRFVASGLRDPDALGDKVPASYRQLAASVARDVDGFFTALKRSGDAVLFDDRVKGRLVDFDERRIVVDPGGAKVELARSALPPTRIARNMRPRSDVAKTASWNAAIAVLELLGGDAKGVHAAKDKSKTSGDLQLALIELDALAESIVRELAAASALDRIVRASGPAELEKTVRAEWPTMRGAELSMSVRARLRELCAERLAPGVPIEAALAKKVHAAVKTIAAGAAPGPSASTVVELTWGFDAPEEASDFVAQPWPELIIGLEEEPKPALPESRSWSVADGMLRPAPAGYVVLPLPFAAGTEIAMDVGIPDVIDDVTWTESRFWFGIEADGTDDRVVFERLGRAIGYDRGSPSTAVLGKLTLQSGEPVHASLKIGPAQTVVARGDVNGRVAFRLDGLARLFLAGVGERCWQIEKLVVRATLPPATIAELKQAEAARVAAALVTE